VEARAGIARKYRAGELSLPEKPKLKELAKKLELKNVEFRYVEKYHAIPALAEKLIRCIEDVW
jgi:hypothetical protein